MAYEPNRLKWKAISLSACALAMAAGSATFLSANFAFSTVGRSLASQARSVCDLYQDEFRAISAALPAQKSRDEQAAGRIREDAVRMESRIPYSRDALNAYEEAKIKLDAAEFDLQMSKFRTLDAPHVLSAAREAVFEESSLRYERRSEKFLLVWWKAGLNQIPAGQLLSMNFQEESSFTLGMQRIAKMAEDDLAELVQKNYLSARTRAREKFARNLEDGAFRAQAWDSWMVRFDSTGCERNPICHVSPPPAEAQKVAQLYRQSMQLSQDGSPETASMKLRLQQLRQSLEKAESARIRHSQDPGSCSVPTVDG